MPRFTCTEQDLTSAGINAFAIRLVSQSVVESVGPSHPFRPVSFIFNEVVFTLSLLPEFELTDDHLREIYRKIAANERPHGGLLRRFSDAVVTADPENFALLRHSMIALAEKYQLWEYRHEADAIKEIP
ncbi:MAG: hypothetical protein WCB68_17920, partial [Pyrinomonadaceae bacterium]